VTSSPEPARPSLPERTSWVLGASGLLGTAVRQAVLARGDRLRTTSVPWTDSGAAVEALLAGAADLPADWRMFWCAGAGVVASAPERLEAELAVVGGFLDRWRPPPGGAIFLASSAGGVYAGSAAPPFTEETEAVPLSPYGETKLRAEALFRDFAARTGVPLFVGRFSNLYGPGQHLDKGQGLISLLLRAHLTGVPLDVYVPLDTIRDYLYVDDAAAMAVAGLEWAHERGVSATKILAAEQAHTIAGVIGEIRRITRRRPPVVVVPSPTARFQSLDLRMRSVVEPSLREHARTPFGVGIQACLAAVEAAVHRPAPVT
jgi:UDP-glucose 4-epimerase